MISLVDVRRPPRTHPTVLIVDDEADMRFVVRTILDRSGFEIEVVGEATDGEEALELFEEIRRTLVPDVVILDHGMPGCSGLEVAAEVLRREPRQTIVLFSAALTPELRQHASDLGIRACLHKTDIRRLPGLVAALVEDSIES